MNTLNPALDVRHKFCDQVAFKGLGTTLTTDAAILDSTKRSFGQGATEVIDVDHPGLN